MPGSVQFDGEIVQAIGIGRPCVVPARRILEIGVEKGQPGWTWKVGADIDSPGVIQDHRVLFAAFDAVLYALNRRNGNLVWRAPLPSRPISGPLVSGRTVLVACHESDVVGVDLKTGKAVGNLRTAARIGTTPLLLGGRLFIGLLDRSVVGFELASFGAEPAPARQSSELLTTLAPPVH
jgi:outer membrane protein assembly factor BamB